MPNRKHPKLSMTVRQILQRDFYRRDALTVARELIGKRLFREINSQLVSSTIYETEAYDGESDLACHAHTGKSARNAVMYRDSGHAYVNFTYGMHWMLNCVTGVIGYPAAVLIRAIMPVDGIAFIQNQRMPIAEKHWCDGPAKLTKALSITGAMNGVDLCIPDSPLQIASGFDIPDTWVTATPRIGIPRTPEPWRSKPWRFIADPARLKTLSI